MARMLSRGDVSRQPGNVSCQKRSSGGRRHSLMAVAAMLAGTVSAVGPATKAHAGIVLLSRQSSLLAQGSGGAGGYNLTDGTTGFGYYANDISDTNAAAPALSSARQFSQPQTTGSLLQGAYAQGSVSASVSSPKSSAQARSVFDVTFEVTQTPAKYTFGGAFGSSGSGTAVAELTNMKSAGDTVFNTTTDASHGVSHEIDQQGFIPPGTYGLQIWANTPGTSLSSSAYYAINLTLNPVTNPVVGGGGAKPPGGGGPQGGGGGAAAAPVPPAAWTGLMMLGGLGVMMLRSRLRGGLLSILT